MIKLYGTQYSPFVRKVRITLELKGLKYQLIEVMPGFGEKAPQGAPDNWGEISPIGKVPAIVDTDTVLSDSSVICEYLEERYPDKPILPKDPAQRARCLWYDEYADTALSATIMHVFRQRIVYPVVLGKPGDETEVARVIKEEEPPIFDYLQSQLKDHRYLVGDGLSLADIAVIGPFINMHHAQHSIDAKRWPLLESYYQHIVSSSPVADIVASEQASMKDALS
jgi:glutathione S-transferase